MTVGGAVLTVRNGPAVGLVALVALLAGLGATVGLGGPAWAVGITSGLVLNAAVIRGLARAGAAVVSAADLVTLTRATLACGVAALVADSFSGDPHVTTMVALTVTALVLDAVDGWVARRTGTVSRFGMRFDGEVDAFLILVLSVYVARSVGWWVLLIGAARYGFAVAGWVLPWLRGQLPPRYWRKVVAATQGIVLTVAAADVLPLPLTYAALAIALVLLAESFGRDVWWSWCNRTRAGRRWGRLVAATVTNTLALLLVWFALLAPNQAFRLTPGSFLRIPVEAVVVAGLAVVLASPARRAMAVVAGVLLGLLTVVKVLDMAFFAGLDRPFNVVTDRAYFSPMRWLVRDAIGPVAGDLVLAAAVVLAVGLLVLMPLALGRLTALVARHRSRSAGIVTALAVLWAVGAVSGLQIQANQPVATANAGRLAADHVRAVSAAVRSRERFEAAAAADPYGEAGDGDLLTGLRGKDVLVVFVESYGRIALEGLPSSSLVRATLDASARRLQASGYSSRSAFLTAPTLGGLSWLAHSTLQTGLLVSDQGRYDRLLASTRSSLSALFDRAGWRTVALMPASREAWPEGERFYRFDQVYDRRNIDYRGPRFGFGTMPDQYALMALERLELAQGERDPVMAMVELASSHAPWAPLPELVDWDRLGDGSVFDRVRDRATSPAELWRDRDDVEAAYAQSVAYSLGAVTSFVEAYGDEDLVLVVVGDHQPATVLSGHGASRDVPITIVAHDPAVLDRVSGWEWQPGLTPEPDAPVWAMDAFRDRFLTTFGPEPRSARARSAAP